MEELSLRRYVNTLLRWWLLILLLPAAAAAAGYSFVELRRGEPMYVAEAQVVVGNQSFALADRNFRLSAQLLMSTQANLAESRTFLEVVARAANVGLTAEQLAGRVEVSEIKDSFLLEIEARASTEERAVLLANTAAEELAARAEPTLPESSPDPTESRLAELEDLAAKIEAGEAQAARLTAAHAETAASDVTGRRALAQVIDVVRGNVAAWQRRHDRVLDALTAEPVLTVASPAVSAELLLGTSSLRTAVAAAVAGLLSAVALAFLLDYLIWMWQKPPGAAAGEPAASMRAPRPTVAHPEAPTEPPSQDNSLGAVPPSRPSMVRSDDRGLSERIARGMI